MFVKSICVVIFRSYIYPFLKKLGQRHIWKYYFGEPGVVVGLQIKRSKWSIKYVDRVILLCQDLFTLRSATPTGERMWK